MTVEFSNLNQMFEFCIVTFDIWLQLALNRLGNEALLQCCYVGLITLSEWDGICVNHCQQLQSPVRRPHVCLLLPFLLFTHHTSHGGHGSCIWSGMCYERGRQCTVAVPWCRVTQAFKQAHRSWLSAVKIRGNYCVAVYCDTILILCRRALKLRRKLRCDTAYWQHCSLSKGRWPGKGWEIMAIFWMNK